MHDHSLVTGSGLEGHLCVTASVAASACATVCVHTSSTPPATDEVTRVRNVVVGPGASASRVRIINFSIAHSQDVYGQLVVYLRLNGVVPPASNPA